MEKTRKDYEREEEKKKDLHVLIVLIPLVALILICLWLFRDVEKDISKSYKGVLVNADTKEEQKVTVELEGSATYESMFADDFYTGEVSIVVKDELGNIILDLGSGLPTMPEEYDDFDWNLCQLREYIEAENKIEFIGTFYFNDSLQQILLKLDNGTYIAAPANNLDEAEAIYNK